MEDAVSDAIITGLTPDPILSILIEIAQITIKENRPLKPNLLDEPILYRRFVGWVRTAIEDASKIDRLVDASPVGGG